MRSEKHRNCELFFVQTPDEAFYIEHSEVESQKLSLIHFLYEFTVDFSLFIYSDIFWRVVETHSPMPT